jgi:hypothetical protein
MGYAMDSTKIDSSSLGDPISRKSWFAIGRRPSADKTDLAPRADLRPTHPVVSYLDSPGQIHDDPWLQDALRLYDDPIEFNGSRLVGYAGASQGLPVYDSRSPTIPPTPPFGDVVILDDRITT